jgi:hypothetical protein
MIVPVMAPGNQTGVSRGNREFNRILTLFSLLTPVDFFHSEADQSCEPLVGTSIVLMILLTVPL